MIMSETMSIYKPIDVELVPFFNRKLAEYNKKFYGTIKTIMDRQINFFKQ